MSTHYHIIDADENFPGCWRPVAEHDFVAYDGTLVKKDDIGGICGKNVKLCQTDFSWIDHDSYVSGSVIINKSTIKDSYINGGMEIYSCEFIKSHLSVKSKGPTVVSLKSSKFDNFICAIINECGTISINRSKLNNVSINDNMLSVVDILIRDAELHNAKFTPPYEECRNINPELYKANFTVFIDNTCKVADNIVGRKGRDKTIFSAPVDFSVPPLDLSGAFSYIDSDYKWRKIDSFVVYLSADNMHIVVDINGFSFELRTDKYNNLLLDEIFNANITFSWSHMSNEARLQVKALLTYAYSYFVQFIKQ